MIGFCWCCPSIKLQKDRQQAASGQDSLCLRLQMQQLLSMSATDWQPQGFVLKHCLATSRRDHMIDLPQHATATAAWLMSIEKKHRPGDRRLGDAWISRFACKPQTMLQVTFDSSPFPGQARKELEVCLYLDPIC